MEFIQSTTGTKPILLRWKAGLKSNLPYRSVSFNSYMLAAALLSYVSPAFMVLNKSS
jgi:hypothetical protein